MFVEPELHENAARNGLSAAAKKSWAAVIAALTVGLMIIAVAAERHASALQTLVFDHIPVSGVVNPVTAVLLNFRSYDTLLEIAVLLIVAISMRPVAEPQAQAPLVAIDHSAAIDPVLSALLRWLVPSTILMAGYILWTGSYSPGGAFQAGALLAGAGVLVSLAGRHRFSFGALPASLLLTLGLAVFMAVGAAVALSSGAILQYPPASAGALILLIESAATISIAAVLLLLYRSLATQGPSPGEALR